MRLCERGKAVAVREEFHRSFRRAGSCRSSMKGRPSGASSSRAGCGQFKLFRSVYVCCQLYEASKAALRLARCTAARNLTAARHDTHTPMDGVLREGEDAQMGAYGGDQREASACTVSCVDYSTDYVCFPR